MTPHRFRTIGALLTLIVLSTLPLAAATVDGLNIHWTSSGKGPNTVILVHGWTCDESTWRDQVPALSKTHRVVTLDLPGHGRSDSPKPENFSMDLFARAVEAVRRETKAERVVLVGHSMGTPVVLRYARLHPKQTAALVLVDGLVTPPAPPPGAPPLGQEFAGPDGRQARERFVRSMFSAATTQPSMPPPSLTTTSTGRRAVLGTSVGMDGITAMAARDALVRSRRYAPSTPQAASASRSTTSMRRPSE